MTNLWNDMTLTWNEVTMEESWNKVTTVPYVIHVHFFQFITVQLRRFPVVDINLVEFFAI